MAAPTIVRGSAGLLETDWDYVQSQASLPFQRLRVQLRFFGRRPAPQVRIISAPTPALRWNVLFLFLPSGVPDADQRRILARLRRSPTRLLVIYAAPAAHTEPPVELRTADALIWKDLSGFDFSAYAVALDTIANHSPGADVYVQNDSVLGPFTDVDAAVMQAAWGLTGFLASAAIENHLSSFAFILRDVTPALVAALEPVLSRRWCYDDFVSVVVGQETRLARVAARSMTVGAFLYNPVRPPLPPLRERVLRRVMPERMGVRPMDLRGDPTLSAPLELLDRDFPFLKRSLFGKFSTVADQHALRARLKTLHW